MTPTLETPRLILKPLALEDAPHLQILFPQWEVVRFLTTRVPWPFPPDGALTYIRDVALPAVARGDEWHWTVRLKTDPARPIGGIDLKNSPGCEDANRGFWLGVPWHGRGLMSRVRRQGDPARTCPLRDGVRQSDVSKTCGWHRRIRRFETSGLRLERQHRLRRSTGDNRRDLRGRGRCGSAPSTFSGHGRTAGRASRVPQPTRHVGSVGVRVECRPGRVVAADHHALTAATVRLGPCPQGGGVHGSSASCGGATRRSRQAVFSGRTREPESQ